MKITIYDAKDFFRSLFRSLFRNLFRSRYSAIIYRKFYRKSLYLSEIYRKFIGSLSEVYTSPHFYSFDFIFGIIIT